MHFPLADLAPTLPVRHPLGQFPSPLEDHPELAAHLGLAGLAVKRDDRNGTPFGGNKLRSLEFLLPTLGRSVVTIGGYGSTWCAALSACAAATGRRTYPALFPQPWNETVAGMLSTTIRHGEPVLARSQASLPIAAAQAWWRAQRIGPPSWLGAGGATPLSVLGSVNAALELVAQVDAAGTPRPDAVIVPCGSCGTAAGLLLGLGLAGWPVTVCAVRVTEPWYATERRVRRLAQRAHDLLRRSGLTRRPELPPLRLIADQLGSGYGHPTVAARQAQRWMAGAGLTVDLTYTAKAAAALARLGASFPRLLFWHTFDSRLVHTPVLDHPLLHRAHLRAESLWPLQKST
jgi:D-cysteine desulfhydrase